MPKEDVVKIALVHVPVLESEAAAIYVARRDSTALFVAGPDFIDADPSCFRHVPFKIALELDDSLRELESLPVGRCAFRSDPSEPWSYREIAVGPTFLLTYEARPGETNPDLSVGGAFITCWVIAPTFEAAERIASEELTAIGWVVIECTGSSPVTSADYQGNTYFRQAQVDGLVVCIDTFSRVAPELN